MTPFTVPFDTHHFSQYRLMCTNSALYLHLDETWLEIAGYEAFDDVSRSIDAPNAIPSGCVARGDSAGSGLWTMFHPREWEAHEAMEREIAGFMKGIEL